MGNMRYFPFYKKDDITQHLISAYVFTKWQLLRLKNEANADRCMLNKMQDKHLRYSINFSFLETSRSGGITLQGYTMLLLLYQITQHRLMLRMWVMITYYLPTPAGFNEDSPFESKDRDGKKEELDKNNRGGTFLQQENNSAVRFFQEL